MLEHCETQTYEEAFAEDGAAVRFSIKPKRGGHGVETKRFVYYKDGNMWIGWLEEYPDYKTQGETLEELEENLRDIYTDLNSDAIPNVHRIGELRVA